ncbi:cytochrome P450 9e2-like [Photinus pyralis]|uniref:cytochrome P450 9e2-like n=1 Tax=Photinus pyralis TaxID=7054 RepID=UPI00126702D2|nr:cytochrome P450 9e2-like [Photinus pyralis]
MLALCLTILTIGFCTLVHRYLHWSRRGIKQYPFWKIWLNNIRDFITQPPLTDAMVRAREDFKNARYIGTYQNFKPRLCIEDPELIKHVFVKDFDYFVDHNVFLPYDGDTVWEKSLFNLKGDDWKQLRGFVSPTFTSSKIKLMFHTILECSAQVVASLKKSGKEIVEFDVKELFGRLTTDVFFGTHFGILCNSVEEQTNEFYTIGQKATNFLGFWLKVRFIVIQVFPIVARVFGLRIFDQNVTNFFRLLVKNNIKSRKSQQIARPDLIGIIMKSENNPDNIELTDEILTALVATFFGAGFDTVSSALMYTFYELSCNSVVQQKLLDEIDANKDNFTYQTVMEMQYLNMVVSETLRKWPVGFFLERQCVKPYRIPALKDDEVEVQLKVGDGIWVPLYALHRDPELFSDPDRFDPEISMERYGLSRAPPRDYFLPPREGPLESRGFPEATGSQMEKRKTLGVVWSLAKNLKQNHGTPKWYRFSSENGITS